MQFLIPPWKHQLEILERAKDRKNYALFAEMGTGKTATAINLLRDLYYKNGRILRTLIFCPPVVRQNWKREFDLHSKVGKDVHVLEGSGKERVKYFSENVCPDAFGAVPFPGIVITNYESLRMQDLFLLFKSWKPEVAVFDESHKLKSHKAQRTKLAIKLADSIPYKYILTGTPVLNTPMDLWGQFRVLDGGETFDKNFYVFRAKYFYDRNAGMPSHKKFEDWVPLPGTTERFNQLVYSKASRVLKKDCLDLPLLVKKRISVELTPAQEKAYCAMKENLITYISEDKAAVASIALTKALRLQQIVSGFVTTDDGSEHSFEKNPRAAALEELLEELTPNHKVIVWACFKQNYRAIEEACKKLKIKSTVLIGGMSDAARQKSVDDFQQDEDTKVIIASQGAGGVGINLTRASYAIYFSRNFSLEADVQSESRNHRGGSERHASITRIDLVAEKTIDAYILEALYRKESVANKILSKEFLGNL